jgi:hypothetical protein
MNPERGWADMRNIQPDNLFKTIIVLINQNKTNNKIINDVFNKPSKLKTSLIIYSKVV